MKKEVYKPKTPDIMEAVFDIGYLTFALISGVLFLTSAGGRGLFILYGILTLTLCGGDAFHLVPRVIRAFKGSSDTVSRMLGRGLQVSSVTMTIFYILLLYIWKLTFPALEAPAFAVFLIWSSALVRIAVCLLPQNDWCGEGNMTLSLIRNGIFALTGAGVIMLYLISGNTYGYHMTRMCVAILISFACYIPVTLFSRKKPAIGMLMIPKTCAYIWMIVMGLQLLFYN